MSDTIAVGDLQVGDVLLYRGTAWLSKAIQFFDGSPVNHVAVYLGDGRVGEAVMEGVVERDIQTSLSGYEWVKVFRLADMPDDMGPVLTRARTYLDQGQRYAFEQLLILAVLCTTRKLKITPVLRRMVRSVLDAAAAALARMLSAGREPMICSEFAFRAYDEAEPPVEDAYSIKVGVMPAVAEDEELPHGMVAGEEVERGVHPYSLAALFAQPASSVWIESPSGPPGLDDVDVPPDADTLDSLIEAYLDEVESGEPSDMAEEVSLEELRAATDRFAVSLYDAATQEEVPLGVGEEMDEAAARLAAYEHLFRTAADFVTPADLYTSPSLALAGTVED